MFLDESAAKLLVVLIISIILALFGVIGLCYGIGCEFKDLNRENKALRQYIAHKQSDGKEQHEEYKAEFERRMKQNTADPARHERNDI